MTNEILYEADGQVAIITLNRPDKRNALNAAMRAGLWDAWRKVESDGDVRVAILTGAGDKAFCAGIDLVEFAETGLRSPPPDFLPDLGHNITVSKPTIAAVRGIAYAGGLRLAQMCDLCVAGEGALFALTEVRVGRGASWAAPLQDLIPPRVAMELLITGEPITARRAYEIGFVNHVVSDHEVMVKAKELAGSIIAGAPLYITAAKSMLAQTRGMSRTEAVRAAEAIFRPVYDSEDAAEGVRAFREKRQPKWQGS